MRNEKGRMRNGESVLVLSDLVLSGGSPDIEHRIPPRREIWNLERRNEKCRMQNSEFGIGNRKPETENRKLGNCHKKRK